MNRKGSQHSAESIATVEADRLASAQQHLARFTSPLLEKTPQGSFGLLGTLTLLSANGEHFVVTATHVVEEAAGKHTYMLDSSAKPFRVEFEFLAGIAKNELDGDSDTIDIAVSRMPSFAVQQLADVWKFWPTNACCERQFFDDAIGYSIFGFPGSKNKYRYRIHPIPYTATKMEANTGSYEKYGVNPKNSIAFDFNQKDMVLLDPKNPEKRTFPTMNGMSGGPVWRTVNFRNIETFVEIPRLTAIVVEK